jgi:hypothetical protein
LGRIKKIQKSTHVLFENIELKSDGDLVPGKELRASENGWVGRDAQLVAVPVGKQREEHSSQKEDIAYSG